MSISIRVDGIDLGNSATKTDSGICFPSKVALGDKLPKNSLALKVKWRDEFYIVGDSTETVKFQDPYKVNTNEYKVCLLLAIALSHPEKVINSAVSVGVPYSRWNNLKDMYREEILSLKEEVITIYYDEHDDEGEIKVINIVDCMVNAEGSIEDFLGDDELPAMVVDFGGGTLDVTTYNFAYKTINCKEVKDIKIEGLTDDNFNFDEVLEKIREELVTKSYKVKTDQDIISILEKDELETFGGSINFKRIRDIQLKSYVHRVNKYLLNKGIKKYPNVRFIGGCSKIVLKYLEELKLVPTGVIKIMKNCKFFNAINYKRQMLKNIDSNKYTVLSDDDSIVE